MVFVVSILFKLSSLKLGFFFFYKIFRVTYIPTLISIYRYRGHHFQCELNLHFVRSVQCPIDMIIDIEIVNAGHNQSLT